MARFLYTLLSLTLAGSALGLIVMLLAKVGKKKLSSGFLYLCWALVILRFCLPLQGIVGPSFLKDAPAVETAARDSDYEAGLYASPYNRTEGLLTREEVNKNLRELTNTAGAVTEPNAEKTDQTSSGTVAARPDRLPLYRSYEFWFYLWLAGALISFCGTLLSFARFRRLLYRTLKPAQPLDSSVLNALNASPFPALYRSDKVSTTVLLGLIRPVIVLPDREYSSEDLDRILRHELTHYRRGDLAIKWLQTLVYSAHWFNPLVYLFRTQTTLYCELSCDQRLLKRMDRQDKQSYGELLLNLAAERALPRRVIAVSFTTQKRDLKERLVQIMTFKKLGKQALALSLAALISILGCAFVLGPARASSDAAQNEAASEAVYETIRVTDADEFIAAIGSNRKIVLAPGEYDLSSSAGYGSAQGTNYYWEDCYDGDFQLVLDVVHNLTIEGEGGAEEVSIVTRPRNAAVLRLIGANDVSISGITCGHTVLPDACQGAVINLYGCRNISISDSVLFGCGTVGIQASECWKLRCENTVIKECTQGAIDISDSYDVTFNGCEFHDCRAHEGFAGLWLIETCNTTFLGIYNTAIYNNHVDSFVDSSNTLGLTIAGCSIHDNRFYSGFWIYGDNVTVDSCEFKDNALRSDWFGPEYDGVLGLDGEKLDAKALESMQLAEFPLDKQTLPVSERPEGTKLSDGTTEYHVSNVDELLKCLGDDCVIYLDGDDYEISACASYGKDGGENYYWTHCYDGYGLVIIGADNLRIVGAEGKTNMELMPRSADVLSFKYCSRVTVENLVLGHVKGAGSCTGDVVSFMGCEECTLSNCELYGCGVNGVNAFGSRDIHVNDSEIYECSMYAAVVSDCEGTEFNNVTIRDCGYNSIETQRCRVRFSGSTYYSPDYKPVDYFDYIYDEYNYDEYDADYGWEEAPEEAVPATDTDI